VVHEEELITTWDGISKYTPFTGQTLRKNYGREMKAAGVVFFARRRKNKTLTVCAYPSVVMRYCALRQWV